MLWPGFKLRFNIKKKTSGGYLELMLYLVKKQTNYCQAQPQFQLFSKVVQGFRNCAWDSEILHGLPSNTNISNQQQQIWGPIKA